MCFLLAVPRSMTTSFWPGHLPLSRIVLNACLIEWVRTYVPLTVATPRTIAKAVSRVRSLRAQSARSATAVMSPRAGQDESCPAVLPWYSRLQSFHRRDHLVLV